MAIMMIVVFVTFEFLDSVQRSESFASDRTTTLDDMRKAVNQLTKDARQATSIDPTSTDSALRFSTYVNGAATTIVWDVSGAQLRRAVNGGTPVVKLDRLGSASIFSYSPSVVDVETITVHVDVKPKNSPDTTLSLSSEIRPRNRSEG